MFHTRKPVARRMFALGLVLCVLPGCGSGGGAGSVTTTTVSRSFTQTFQGQNAALAAYTLDAPIDQTKPFSVTVGGVLLVQGKDYFIDPNLPNVVHINNPVSADTQVVIQYTTLATTTERFIVNATGQTKFTLSQAVDTSKPLVITLVRTSIEASSSATLTPQDYTLDTNNQKVIRLNQALTPPVTLVITYVPKAL